MPKRLTKAALASLAAVTGKRARIVIEHLRKYGSITTDDLKERYGYDHPPRAIKDVSDQGIPLVKTIIRKKDGKRMAEYRFGDLGNIAAGRTGGRINFSKAFKGALVAEYGSRCCLCNVSLEARYLQIDHRIPYLVGGEGTESSRDVKDYMLVCGSCNRAKSWSCEHCPNGLVTKDARVCATCYWAYPLAYAHVATQDIRRLDLTWTGDEVRDYESAKAKAAVADQQMPNFVKEAVRRAIHEQR